MPAQRVQYPITYIIYIFKNSWIVSSTQSQIFQFSACLGDRQSVVEHPPPLVAVCCVPVYCILADPPVRQGSAGWAGCGHCKDILWAGEYAFTTYRHQDNKQRAQKFVAKTATNSQNATATGPLATNIGNPAGCAGCCQWADNLGGGGAEYAFEKHDLLCRLFPRQTNCRN